MGGESDDIWIPLKILCPFSRSCSSSSILVHLVPLSRIGIKAQAGDEIKTGAVQEDMERFLSNFQQAQAQAQGRCKSLKLKFMRNETWAKLSTLGH